MSCRALVIGAGLAGAATANALVRQGWKVVIADAGAPASGASALPVGILSPLLTKAPTTLSRLSELGAAAMHTELRRLLPEGKGWQSCHIDNLGHAPGRWPAAVVQPSLVVEAWLQEASATNRLSFLTQTRVHSIELREAAAEAGPDEAKQASTWVARSHDGGVIAEANSVVLATAWPSVQLLKHSALLTEDEDLFPLRPVKGQMSYAPLFGEPVASRPMRNNGVFVPAFSYRPNGSEEEQRIWAMGSTYERGVDDQTVSWEGHLRNLTSLRTMSRSAAATMAHTMDAPPTLQGWAGVRCASLDRVPVMGEMPNLPLWASAPRSGRGWPRQLQPTRVPRLRGLYVLAALGSRGLTLAHWAGIQLASLMSGQGFDFDAELQLAVDPARFGWRKLRQQVRPD